MSNCTFLTYPHIANLGEVFVNTRSTAQDFGAKDVIAKSKRDEHRDASYHAPFRDLNEVYFGY